MHYRRHGRKSTGTASLLLGESPDSINPCSDFGSIFNELLPGNFAKLQPLDPEGQDLTQGLEVKVRLGSVWKQSLTELSGGQRYVYGVKCS